MRSSVSFVKRGTHWSVCQHQASKSFDFRQPLGGFVSIGISYETPFGRFVSIKRTLNELVFEFLNDH